MSMLKRLKALFGGGSSNGDCAATGSDMITCEEALRVVQEFLDGELESGMEGQVKAHFDRCVTCYPHLDFENAYREAVGRAVRGEKAPPALRAKVAALIAEEGADE